MNKKPTIICVTGGKGGTGKTLVAFNLAVIFKNSNKKVLLIDGDVENPNTYLLLGAELENKKPVPFFKPKIIEEGCIKCGLCAQNCAPHALLYIQNSYPIPMLTLCSGCKLCYKICPNKAIEADFKTIGYTYSTTINNLSLLIGELKPSEARSAAVVEDLLEKLDDIIENMPEKYDFVILDTAPGAHCDIVVALEGADLILNVTEPTVFGQHDLERILKLIEMVNKEATSKIILNRADMTQEKNIIYELVKRYNCEVIKEIPMDIAVMKSYSEGVPVCQKYPESPAAKAFNDLYDKVCALI